MIYLKSYTCLTDQLNIVLNLLLVLLAKATGNCLIKIGKNELLEYRNHTYLPIDSPITVMAGDRYFVKNTDSGLETEKVCQFDSPYKSIYQLFGSRVLFETS